MKALIDTNVVLDVLLDRRPYSVDAVAVFTLVETGRIRGLLCATTVTTIDYLLLQSMSRRAARDCIGKLVRLFDVAPVNRAVIEGAMRSRMADFEDAVVDQAALLAGADVVVTRNAKDFAHGSVPAMDPREFLVGLSA